MNQLERLGLVSPMSRRAILRGVGAGLATSLLGGWGDGRGPGGFPTNPTGPALDVIGGVTIQGAAVEQDGGFSPQPPYSLPISDGQVTCYVNALSAALIVLE